jgi:hypothetical protein
MRKINWLIVTLFLIGLGPVGCKKAADVPPESLQVNGVWVDMPKLEKTFSTTTDPQIQKSVFDADQGLRYGDHNKALAAVEELSNNPNVTEDQKKVVTDVLGQLKKLTGAAPAQ